MHCRHCNLIEQPQLFKVYIHLQILHHQRIRAPCCPWGKAAWTRSLLTSWASFCSAGSPSTWTLSPPECWWLERRGISSPASKILEIAGSTKPRDPCPHPELALYCTCKQFWIANTEFVNNLLSSASSSSSSSILSSNSSKSSSLLLGLEGCSCATKWSDFLRVLDFLSADYMAIILLKSATTNVQGVFIGPRSDHSLP